MERYNAENYKDIADALQAKIEDFLARHTQYPTDVVVGIDPQSRQIELNSPNKLAPTFLQFSIVDFIITNEKGLYEPDVAMIFGR